MQERRSETHVKIAIQETHQKTSGEQKTTVPSPLPQESRTPAHAITIINRTTAVEKAARKTAEEQIRAKQREGTPWNPVHWPRKLRFKFGEEFYRQRGIQRARDAMLKENNVFLKMDTLKNKTIDATAGKAADNAEAQAKIALVKKYDELTGSNQQVEKAHDPVKELLTQEVFRPVITGEITTDAEVQTTLRKFVQKHIADRDKTVRRQLKKTFGNDATQFERTAEYFATDILEVGEAIKADQKKQGWSLDQLSEHIDFKLANTNWAADTAPYMSRADRWIQKNSKENTHLPKRSLAGALARRGIVFNETTVGAAASIGTFFGYRGAYRAVAALSAGVGAGLLVGAVERNRNLKIDMASHRADTEYGAQAIDQTKRNGVKGKTIDFMDTRKKLDRYRYDIASVDTLLHGNPDRDGNSYVARGLHELVAADVSTATAATQETRQQLIKLLAETQERLHHSAKEKVGLIQYSSEQQVEQERLLLEEKIHEGRNHLLATGMTAEQINQAITEQRTLYQKQFAAHRKKQDKRFGKYRAKSAMTMGVFGGAIGFVTGLATQQGIAEIARHTDHPTKSTLLEKWTGHGKKKTQTSGVVHESLPSPSEPSGKIGNVAYHTDAQGKVFFDTPGQKSVQSGIYHQDTNTIVVQGDMQSQFPGIYDQLKAAHVTVEVQQPPTYTTPITEWHAYTNGTAQADGNELKLFDHRAGQNGVTFDMSHMMAKGSMLDGQFIDVTTLNSQNKTAFAFWNHHDPNHPILVKAHEGVLTLDKTNASDMVDIYQNGQWKPVPNADIAKTVLGELDDFKNASDRGHQDILNYNVSAVALDQHNNIIDSFATAQGKSNPIEPKQTATTLIHLPHTEAVPTPTVTNEGAEAALFTLPFTPRNPLRKAEQTLSRDNIEPKTA